MPTNEYEIQPEDLPAEFAEVAGIIGLEAALALAQRRGGESLYVPKPESIARAARDRAIRAAFNGANYADLAHLHGLTVTWVRKIVHGDGGGKDAAVGGMRQESLF